MKAELKSACVLLTQPEVGAALQAELQARHPKSYALHTTHQGTLVLVSSDEALPHFVLVQDSGKAILSLLQWTENQLHPRAYISSGVLGPGVALPNRGPADAVYAPAQCLRSAGPVVLSQSFVLYEEIVFDAETQDRLTKPLGLGEESVLRNPIFSSDKDFLPEKELRWLAEKTRVLAYDNLSGNLLKYALPFGARVGCLKFLAAAESERPAAERRFLDYWLGA